MDDPAFEAWAKEHHLAEDPAFGVWAKENHIADEVGSSRLYDIVRAAWHAGYLKRGEDDATDDTNEDEEFWEQARDEFNLPEYKNIKYKEFVIDVMRGILDGDVENVTLRHYEGRCSYRGPAAVADSIGDVMSLTKVKCTSDNMGKSYVVYPQ
jgi:hypothetical protein